MAHLDLQRGNFGAADTLLGKRSSRKIGHNTRLERLGEDRIGVRYHATVIVTFTRDGWTIVNTHGWRTVTTMARVNALLSGPFGVHSNRGDMKLYRSGQPILDYVDGIAVNVNTGAVGLAGPNGPVGVLLTAEDVDAIVAGAEERDRLREEKRQARLLREHPVAFTAVAEDAAGPHRQGYNGRARGCARCGEEARLSHERARERLAREHAAILAGDESGAGSHRRERTDYVYPKDAEGRPVYRDGVRTVSIEYRCPWGCPSRKLTATYGDVLLTLGEG